MGIQKGEHKMKKCVLGIDLGTSSVKILKKYQDGSVQKLKNIYRETLPLGWWNSILELLEKIDWQEVTAIGLSSQVGTYIVNDKDVIGWNQNVGKEELEWWKEKYPTEKFLEEISMPHPDIISYPLPRLKYIKDHFENVETVCQPKEYILKQLTGEWVTDPYSWRGLANLDRKEYSKFFLDELSIDLEKLPPIKKQDEIAGYTKKIELQYNVLPEGIPVYVGLNDYYAGLLGMGVGSQGQMFDLTGTSEHVGVIQQEIIQDTVLVCGPYVKNMVHYGVTASSGPSIKYGLRLLASYKAQMKEETLQKDDNKDVFWTLNLCKMMEEKPPIFLPYLKGERAPIWNADARGGFLGLEENTSLEQMIYAVMEGVVFSLYHIYETMGKPQVESITISGGAAEIDYLNALKAEVFGSTVRVVEESDVSALGACMVAAVGSGMYESYEQVANEWVQIKRIIEPSLECKAWFEKRFALYKEFYHSIKPLYETWKQL